MFETKLIKFIESFIDLASIYFRFNYIYCQEEDFLSLPYS